MNYWILPFLFMVAAMIFDEFYFHHRRGLPLWERIGHPLDTLTILACFLFLYFTSYSIQNLKIYLALAIFSSLFVTKDEFVHHKECTAGEQWVHALLFLLHPTILGIAGWLWINSEVQTIFLIQIIGIATFLIYQILYWSFRHERSQQRHL